MSASSLYRHDRTKSFDYLCVDAFIKSIVDARALGTAFELGLIDYLGENQHRTLDDLKRKFECDGQGLRLLLNLLMANGVIEECNGEIQLCRQFIKALKYSDLLKAKLEFAEEYHGKLMRYVDVEISRESWPHEVTKIKTCKK